MEMRIEHGIPLPLPNCNETKTVELALRMDIGDSIYFAPDSRGRHGLIRALQKLKRRPLVRLEGEGYRVWRVS